MAIPWATNLLHGQLNKLFKKMVSNLALFYVATYLATFQKIGQFFPNHLVTLHPPPILNKYVHKLKRQLTIFYGKYRYITYLHSILLVLT